MHVYVRVRKFLIPMFDILGTALVDEISILKFEIVDIIDGHHKTAVRTVTKCLHGEAASISDLPSVILIYLKYSRLS